MRICAGASSGSGLAAAAGAYCTPIPVLQCNSFIIPALCAYIEANSSHCSMLAAAFALPGDVELAQKLSEFSITMRNVVDTMGQLASKVDQLGQPTVYDTTPAALGQQTLESLMARGAVCDFESNIPPTKVSAVPVNRHQQPVLDSAQQQALMNCKSEAEVVEVLTPVLWHLLIADIDADACSSVLVSSTLLFWKRHIV
jgi:hypothetical protein